MARQDISSFLDTPLEEDLILGPSSVESPGSIGDFLDSPLEEEESLSKRTARGFSPSVEGGGLIDRAKQVLGQGAQIAQGVIDPTVQGTVTRPLNLTQRAAEIMGEFSAEELGRAGIDPRIAAGAGTFITEAPNLAVMAGIPSIRPNLQALTPETGKRVLGATVRKGIKLGAGVPEQAQKVRFERPQAVREARPLSEIGESVANVTTNLKTKITNIVKDFPTFNDIGTKVSRGLQDLQKTVSELDDQAWNSLLKLKAEPRSGIIRILNDVKRQFKTSGGVAVGPSAKKVDKTITGIIDDVSRIKQKGATPGTEQFLNQQDLRKIIQALDKNINYADPLASEANAALLSARVKIMNQLRNNNSEFASIMDPLAQRTELLNNASREFSIAKLRGEFVPGNTTSEKLKGLLRSGRVEGQRIAKQFKEETGIDVLGQGEKARFLESFELGKLEPGLARFDPVLRKTVGQAERLRKGFGLQESGGGFIPSDRTTIALQGVSKPGKVTARRILKTTGEKGEGQKLLTDAENRVALEEFLRERSGTGGIVRGGLGALTGFLLDPLIPGSAGIATTAGLATAQIANVFGGRISGKLIDALSRVASSPIRLETPLIAATSSTIDRLTPQPKPLDRENAKRFLREAKGDKKIARQLAIQAGFTIPKRGGKNAFTK